MVSTSLCVSWSLGTGSGALLLCDAAAMAIRIDVGVYTDDELVLPGDEPAEVGARGEALELPLTLPAAAVAERPAERKGQPPPPPPPPAPLLTPG